MISDVSFGKGRVAKLPEARKLKAGRWRLYKTPGLYPLRDPGTGAIATFDSLEEARHWWRRLHPVEPPPTEALKCARCGAYFGPTSSQTLYAGRYYHPQHTPQAVNLRRQG
jgi:hypothetical protein